MLLLLLHSTMNVARVFPHTVYSSERRHDLFFEVEMLGVLLNTFMRPVSPYTGVYTPLPAPMASASQYQVGTDFVDFAEPPKPRWKLSRGETVKERTFQTPLVSWLYERGWRQGFNVNGFPGIDEEFRLVISSAVCKRVIATARAPKYREKLSPFPQVYELSTRTCALSLCGWTAAAAVVVVVFALLLLLLFIKAVVVVVVAVASCPPQPPIPAPLFPFPLHDYRSLGRTFAQTPLQHRVCVL